MQINAKFWSKELQNRTKRPIMGPIVNGIETNSANSWLSYAKLWRRPTFPSSFHVEFFEVYIWTYMANVQYMFQAPNSS